MALTKLSIEVPEGDWPVDGLEPVHACPVCGSADRRLLYSDLQDRIFLCAPGVWRLYLCGQCGGGYLDPRPNAATIGLAYRHYYTHSALTTEDQSETAAPQSLQARLKQSLVHGYINAEYGYALKPASPLGPFLCKLLPRTQADNGRKYRLPLPRRGARLLDVGCGDGSYVQLAQRLGWQAQGTDLDAIVVENARKAGLQVDQGTLEEQRFPDNTFDAVTLAHVMEHLPTPLDTLRECLRVLKPGGVIWIATPNLNSTAHRLFGKHWRGLEPPRHLVLFVPSSLQGAMERVGFQRCRQLSSPWISEWFFRCSAGIAHGEDPYAASPLPDSLLRQARENDRQAHRNPVIAEELDFIGFK